MAKVKKYTIFCLLVTIQLVLLFYFHRQIYNQIESIHEDEHYVGAHPAWKNYLVDTEKCKIPEMDPYDSAIKYYFRHADNPSCMLGRKPSLVASNRTAIYIDKSALKYYNVQNVNEELDCCYKPFSRPSATFMQVDDEVILETSCYKFKEDKVISNEFIYVKCKVLSGKHKTEVQDVLAFTPKISLTKPTTSGVNVLILGLDSVSRLNFHRQMPKTSALLNELSAIQLLGYNKVGDNTFENLVPALTGLSVRELADECWSSKYSFFDNCPIIWKSFKEAGFYTAYGEDYADSSAFNLHKAGFRHQPTDYYPRPFFLHGDKVFNTISGKCYGETLKFEKLLDYMTKFITTVDHKYFGFFWETTLTHNLLNYPKVVDDLVSDFINTINLNETVLILMSDHGTRVGEFTKTYQGSIENRLPMIFFLLPKWFRSRYELAVESMIRNTRRLTTHFDLHETLLDFINLNDLENSVLKNRLRTVKVYRPRGLSLFLPIPENRTCSEAGISPHWCTCHQSNSISIIDPIVSTSAQKLVQKINTMLTSFEKCAVLQLLEIISARVQVYPRQLSIKDYHIVITTIPGQAVFGGTIRITENENNFVTLNVEENIDRLNLYGNQSSCITDHKFQPFCYCV